MGVPDDKVTIDPEFRRSGHRRGGGLDRGPGWLALAGLAVALSALGWLLAAPDGANPPLTDGQLDGFPTVARPPEAVTTAGRAPSLGVPLREAVPGFTETITAVTWSNQGVEVLRWPASESAPATMLALGHVDGGRNRSADASGRWLVEIRGESALGVYVVNDGSPRTHEPRRLSGAFSGARAWSAAWHDAQPGRLAWLACPEEDRGSAPELHRLDLGDPRSEPAVLSLPGFSCEDRRVWLAAWGDWGMLLYQTEGSGIVQVLLGGDGRQLARAPLGPQGEWFVGVGPGGTTVWTEGLGRPGASSFLLAHDGIERRPVPGVAGGERLESALVSPGGSLLALVPDLAGSGSMVRIVAVDTGDVVAEIIESRSWVSKMVWSTDGRFLVYERWPDVASNWAGVPRHVELVFYDTELATAAAVRLPGYAAALRSAR